MTLYEDLGRILKLLLMDDPYYALFMMSLDKQETTKVPTLAVGLNGVNVVLYINPDFWFKLTKQQKFGVCKHEMMHLCFMHLVDNQYYPNRKKDNIAADLEINQYIDPTHLPEGGITLDSVKAQMGLTLPPKQGRDFYYRQLGDKCNDYELGENEHFWEIFEQLSPEDQAVVRNQLESIMEKTADEVRKSRGSVPGEIESILTLIKKPARFDWKKFLRQWTGNSVEVFLKSTRFKPNPYFPGTPSNKIKLKQNILCAIDTSGSVSESELHEFMSEIHNLWKFGHTISILCVDTQIYDPYIYNGSSEITIHGRGGTYFTPTLEYFNSHNEYSCMIYFTDGEAELPPRANKPMLWVVSSRGTTRAIEKHNGKILKIEE